MFPKDEILYKAFIWKDTVVYCYNRLIDVYILFDAISSLFEIIYKLYIKTAGLFLENYKLLKL